MKYESELIKEIVDSRGHEKSSLHYQSECIKTWVDEAKGAYPKLCDYQSEWLEYISILDDTGGSEDPEPPIGQFPYETVTTSNTATVNHVVPLAYKTAILKGQTKILDDLGNEWSSNNSPSVITGAYIDTTNGNFVTSSVSFYTGFLECPAVDFHIKGDNRYKRISFYDKNKVFIGGIDKKIANNTPVKIGLSEVPKNAIYIRISGSTSGSNLSYTPNTNIFITDTNGNNLYTTHLESVKMPVLTTSNEDGTKSIILTVNESIELQGIGDVQDTLDCLTGEVVKNTKEVVLNGSEEWAENGYETMKYYCQKYKDGKSQSLKVLSDKIPTDSKATTLALMNLTTTGKIQLITNFSTVNELKDWLSQNPITVQYELATPVIKTVNLTVVNQDGEPLSKIKPIEGTMHIEVSGTPINPTAVLEVPVEAIAQNLNSFIEED